MAKTKFDLSEKNGATRLRHLTSTPAVDSTTIDDTHFPADDACSPAGFKSVMVFCRFTAGTAPTATLQFLHRVEPTTVAGSGWAVGPTTVTLSEGQAVWVETMGRDFYPRLAARTGAPTGIDIYASGWESFRYDGPRA